MFLSFLLFCLNQFVLRKRLSCVLTPLNKGKQRFTMTDFSDLYKKNLTHSLSFHISIVTHPLSYDREIAIVLKAVTTLTRVNTRSYQRWSWSVPHWVFLSPEKRMSVPPRSTPLRSKMKFSLCHKQINTMWWEYVSLLIYYFVTPTSGFFLLCLVYPKIPNC